jgi:RHS repeat-associated protein
MQNRNLLAEIANSGAVIRRYHWGVDLSGNREGAGGVGGLLAITSGNASQLPLSNGNGNIVGTIDAATGQRTAEYEYGPFGEPLRATGPLANANPFRFSTKYCDEETGLVYYGYRYYDANKGRWLNRDPIEEADSDNLYAFSMNDGINFVDMDGLRRPPARPRPGHPGGPPVRPGRPPGWPPVDPSRPPVYVYSNDPPMFSDPRTPVIPMPFPRPAPLPWLPPNPGPNPYSDATDPNGKKCAPCKPPVGTEAYRHDKCAPEGDSRLHKPCPGSHVHWYVVSQRPPHAFVEPCKCEWVLNKGKAGTHSDVECVQGGWKGPQGISSNGDKTPVGGGGFAP